MNDVTILDDIVLAFEPEPSGIPRTRLASFRRIALGALITLVTPGSAWAVCTLLWGHSPTLVCLLHGELAKEGLVVDVNGRCFSVGYEDIGAGAKRALQKYLQLAPNADDAEQIREEIKGL